jgi:hypothetical protein
LQIRDTCIVAWCPLLGARKIKKKRGNINFVMSMYVLVCLSVHVEQLGSHWKDFREILYLNIFRKSVERIQVPLKSDKYIGHILHEDQYTFMIISRSFLLGMRNVSDESCRKNQNSHCMFSFFFSKIVPFMR